MHSCQVSENRMLENKECCTAALRNCEGAYSGILEKAFTIKYSSHSTKGIYS